VVVRGLGLNDPRSVLREVEVGEQLQVQPSTSTLKKTGLRPSKCFSTRF
jgi:hypothetical protein